MSFIFGSDMNSSVHIDNKGKDIFILGEGPTQGLDYTSLTAEDKYTFVYVCIIIEATVFVVVNARKINQFKIKDSEIKNTPCV